MSTTLSGDEHIKNVSKFFCLFLIVIIFWLKSPCHTIVNALKTEEQVRCNVFLDVSIFFLCTCISVVVNFSFSVNFYFAIVFGYGNVC